MAFIPKFRLLCLSNGHGEDIIAVRILQELQQYSTQIELAALPLVGEGKAYAQLEIPAIARVQAMPSGGFIYMDGRQLAQDLRGGLLHLTLAQIKAVRGWVKSGGVVLAVGDIVPLLFAWSSGANYAFVGTAKSEYYLRDEAESLPRRSLFARLEGWSGSVYLPWERWLMSRPRCQAVFPRDTLTTKTLQKWAIPAFDLGNPMMDRLTPVNPSDLKLEQLSVLLLPGSRPPEAYANWQQILVAVTSLQSTFSERSLLFLGAIAPGLSLELCGEILKAQNWHQVNSKDPIPNLKSKIQNWQALVFQHKNAQIILSQHAYNDYLHIADVAIAMAGTATEQFVGLGKPAIAIPGKGPQFTYAFAEAQSRLLGSSLLLVQQPTQVADAIKSLLSDKNQLELIAANGLRRMGKPGAAHRIAACLMAQFGYKVEPI